MLEMTLTPSQRLASVEDMLLYRLSQLTAAAEAMVVRLCEGGYGITRREWAMLAQLHGHPDGLLSSDATCDGSGSSPSLTWRNPPAGTKSFALLMSTDPGDGVLKYNWVNYNLSASLTGLPTNSILVGTFGAGSGRHRHESSFSKRARV